MQNQFTKRSSEELSRIAVHFRELEDITKDMQMIDKSKPNG